MTTSDGGVNTDVDNTAVENTNDNNAMDDGKNDIQKQFDDLNAKFEILLKESKGKDSKISQLLKEKETQSLASKTAEEQLEYYRNQTAAFERKEAFRQSFKEVGLNPEEFIGIVDEKDPAIQAGKFAAILKAQKEESARLAVEKFKADELAKIGGKEPNTKEKIVSTNSDNAAKNDFLRGGILD